jgi:Galactose oxidase, central domain
LYIHGGKIDQNNAYSYNSAPNTDELLALNFEKSFDLSSTPWTTLNATGGPSLAFHTITAYSTSQALVFGGNAGNDDRVPLPTRNDSTWQLTVDGASAGWISHGEGWADQPMRRQYHSSVIYQDIIYITGGEKADGSSIAFSQPYAFDPSGPTFKPIAAANGPSGLVGHAALALGDGRIALLGGLSRSTNALQPLDTIYIYNVTQSIWSTLTVGGSSIPVPRRDFAATVIDADKVLIHGGADASCSTALSDGAILDLKRLQWSAVPALSQTLGSRFDHTAVTVGTSVFFLFGEH